MATANRNKTAATVATAAATKPALAALPGAPATGMRQVLQVISKRDGFRRAGREWHGTTIVPLSELSTKQYEQIDREPMLVAQLLEVPEEQVAELAARDDAGGSETGT